MFAQEIDSDSVNFTAKLLVLHFVYRHSETARADLGKKTLGGTVAAGDRRIGRDIMNFMEPISQNTCNSKVEFIKLLMQQVFDERKFDMVLELTKCSDDTEVNKLSNQRTLH